MLDCMLGPYVLDHIGWTVPGRKVSCCNAQVNTNAVDIETQRAKG